MGIVAIQHLFCANLEFFMCFTYCPLIIFPLPVVQILAVVVAWWVGVTCVYIRDGVCMRCVSNATLPFISHSTQVIYAPKVTTDALVKEKQCATCVGNVSMMVQAPCTQTTPKPT